jgi:uncharacterized protein
MTDKQDAIPASLPAKTPPTVTEENRPFWDAARDGRLVMQQCTRCSHIRYPIQALCPNCLHDEYSWMQLSGLGSVFAVVIYHQAFNKAWAGDLPYNVAIIQLDEGPRMFSNVVGGPSSDVAVGDRVAVVFEPFTDDPSESESTETLVVPRFRRVS